MGFGGTDHPVTFRRLIIKSAYYCELVGHCRSWRSVHGCRLRGTGRRPRRGSIVVVLHQRRRDQDPAGHRRLHRRGGRSGHDKLLDLRAERHADAARADPTDFDAHYSWALVLQEQAERAEQSGMDPNRRDAILIDACAKYAKARDLRANSISTLYNWGIALGDRARLKGDAGDAVEARAMWRQACEKYRAAVECDASRTQSTQALNNWGLALQQMATLERDPGARERRLLAAVGRFREAIRRDPGFHRAVYNLGTIMYALSERARGHGGRDTRGGGRSEHADGASNHPEDSNAGAHTVNRHPRSRSRRRARTSSRPPPRCTYAARKRPALGPCTRRPSGSSGTPCRSRRSSPGR